MKHVLVLFQKPCVSHETRTFLWMMHHFLFHLQWVWTGEGVKWLTPSFQDLLEETEQTFKQLIAFTPTSVYFEEDALVTHGLNSRDFIFPAQPLSALALMEKMVAQDIILTPK